MNYVQQTTSHSSIELISVFFFFLPNFLISKAATLIYAYTNKNGESIDL